MQKITETRRKYMLMRIISLACFIFVIVAAPSVATLMNGTPLDRGTDSQLTFYENVSDGLINQRNTDDEPNIEKENVIAADNDVGDEAECEKIMQSETEVFKPALSESYMLRELFSNVEFNEDDDVTGSVPPKTVGDSISDAKTESAESGNTKIEGDSSHNSKSGEDNSNSEVKDAKSESRVNNRFDAKDDDKAPASTGVVIGNSKGRITTVRVLDSGTGMVSSLDLDEYLAQVIISEMPSYAGDEALKAQAVASRTFVVNRIVNSSTHDNADVCTNPGHCQAFLEKNAFIAKYGNSGQHYYDRAYSAAKQTSGQIVTYNGSPITAAYHASSGGSTMASADVWGGSLPYLVSVYSPEKDDPEMLSLISSHKTYSKSEFISRLVSAGYSAAGEYYNSGFGDFLGSAVQSSSGKVDYMTVAGEYVSGQKFKSIFSLRSTCFTVNYDSDNITFVCLGYGHGVGMSQLGACTMAKQGSNYTDILTHYYTGVEVAVW